MFFGDFFSKTSSRCGEHAATTELPKQVSATRFRRFLSHDWILTPGLWESLVLCGVVLDTGLALCIQRFDDRRVRLGRDQLRIVAFRTVCAAREELAVTHLSVFGHLSSCGQ
jgi:hypothetical protein